MTVYTITKDEQRNLHNGLCYLHSAVEGLADVISDSKLKNLTKALELIEKGFENVRKQENDTFSRKAEHFDNVREQEGFTSIWSMYDVEDLDAPHPFSSDSFVMYADHWGENKNTHYPVMGTTFRDLYRAADKAIENSGDNHHLFIEQFVVKNGNELHLVTGS